MSTVRKLESTRGARRVEKKRRQARNRVLDGDEKRQVVDAFTELLDGLYAHLPLKRAAYGNDPVQRLRALKLRVDEMSDRQFHHSMAEIVTDLRDAHTRYIAPEQLEGEVAYLPIAIERYTDAEGTERYIVSRISKVRGEDERLGRLGLEQGVEVTHWNGVPMGDAIDGYAERETGGRADARRARAIESLCFRSLRYGMFPVEAWVDLAFRSGRRTGEVRLHWEYATHADTLTSSAGAEGSGAFAYANDPAAEQRRRQKKALFAARGATARRRRPAAKAKSTSNGDWRVGRFAEVVSARTVTTEARPLGHLRLWSFDLQDDDGFVLDVIELLKDLPRDGLVIDLRGNPGGLIWAAERLLQLFTPQEIAPTRFSMLATDLTRAMAAAPQNIATLQPWRESLEAAVITGELYSRGVPLTPPERCNDLGQVYPGPVVAVVDANTYSAGDLFAAGFVDNNVGTLVSVDEATGAGGANVWTQGHVDVALSKTRRSRITLPDGVGYTVACRRAVRAADASGMAIEDVGVAGHVRRPLTERDVRYDNPDLLDFCERLLASEPVTDMVAEVRRNDHLVVNGSKIDRIDVYVDGRPRLSEQVDVDDAKLELPLPKDWSSVEVKGFSGDLLRQQRILRPRTR